MIANHHFLDFWNIFLEKCADLFCHDYAKDAASRIWVYSGKKKALDERLLDIQENTGSKMHGVIELQNVIQKSRLPNSIDSNNHNALERMDVYVLTLITDNLRLACVSHSSPQFTTVHHSYTDEIKSRDFHNPGARLGNIFDDVLSKIRREYTDKQDLGTKFEKIAKNFLLASWDVKLL